MSVDGLREPPAVGLEDVAADVLLDLALAEAGGLLAGRRLAEGQQGEGKVAWQVNPLL